VEEIAKIWEPWGGPGGYYPDWVKVQRAKATIALTLKAVVDGELDEALGVVGWGKMVACWDLLSNEPVVSGCFDERDIGKKASELDEKMRFIALSPEGQEEEG